MYLDKYVYIISKINITQLWGVHRIETIPESNFQRKTNVISE